MDWGCSQNPDLINAIAEIEIVNLNLVLRTRCDDKKDVANAL